MRSSSAIVTVLIPSFSKNKEKLRDMPTDDVSLHPGNCLATSCCLNGLFFFVFFSFLSHTVPQPTSVRRCYLSGFHLRGFQISDCVDLQRSHSDCRRYQPDSRKQRAHLELLRDSSSDQGIIVKKKPPLTKSENTGCIILEEHRVAIIA